MTRLHVEFLPWLVYGGCSDLIILDGQAVGDRGGSSLDPRSSRPVKDQGRGIFFVKRERIPVLEEAH